MSDLTDFLLARIAEESSGCAGSHRGGDDPNFPWGPDRIRDECESKQHIVEALRETEAALGPGCFSAVEFRSGQWDGLVYACRLLAIPYADHPDYREEWKREAGGVSEASRDTCLACGSRALTLRNEVSAGRWCDDIWHDTPPLTMV